MNYKTPKMEIVELEATDIITTSGLANVSGGATSPDDEIIDDIFG